LQNVEVLTDNAANVSANLRDISKSLNDPNNLLVVQQTLNSARATFENAQKITADLDELTGDPSFRTNLRKLVDGLSKLVSYTDTLEQQITTASTSSVESNKSFSHFSSLNADRIVSTSFDFGDRLCFSPCTPNQEAE
jgi:phospholipid/cholesterol/gamma-HCH transport system substrate-binding protein